jgi:hypothetical protein
MNPVLSSECWTVVATIGQRNAYRQSHWVWKYYNPREVEDFKAARDRGEIISCNRKAGDGWELVARLPKNSGHNAPQQGQDSSPTSPRPFGVANHAAFLQRA